MNCTRCAARPMRRGSVISRRSNVIGSTAPWQRALPESSPGHQEQQGRLRRPPATCLARQQHAWSVCSHIPGQLKTVAAHSARARAPRQPCPAILHFQPVCYARSMFRSISLNAPTTTRAIAVVGIGARFPGANSVEQFWNNLTEERESILTLDEETLRENEIDCDSVSSDPDFVPRAGIVDHAEDWDSDFFGLTPRQAALMDPQHRVWLECAWDAFEDAAFDPTRFAGNCGVFMGIGTRGNYLMANVVPDRAYLDRFVRNGDVDVYETQLLNDRDYIATRTAQVFGLRGPAATVQSACSTSLLAVTLGCQNLWSGECDAVVVGGSSIQFPQQRGYRYQPGGIFSKDGSTRSFDRDASGTIFSCGVGAVLLQRLDDALADRREIYAVIRGAAVNNDGGQGSSYLAPAVDGQRRVIERTLELSGVDPRSISFVE